MPLIATAVSRSSWNPLHLASMTAYTEVTVAVDGMTIS